MPTETPANCARPGCGHQKLLALQITVRTGEITDQHGHGSEGCMECPCPAYRTQSQTEALEAARRWLAHVQANSGIDRGPGEIDQILKCLLDEFP